MSDTDNLRARFALLSPHLDEQGRRLLAAAEAKALGRGGIKIVSALTGVAASTIGRGSLRSFGSADDPHPVQAALLEHQAGQCGYCLGGIIASAISLYERPCPVTDDEIMGVLDRHLCRCGTHHRILNAVRSALRGKERP